MYCVYILKSLKDNRLYIGCTENLQNRIESHDNVSVKSTGHRRPFVPIHSEEFKNKTEAFNRERFLKSLWDSREKGKF